MGRTKQLLEQDRHVKPDWAYDLEYLEWVYYTQLPHITHKNENKQDTMGEAQN